MKNIAIYGAGGFGREVACMLSKINERRKEWNLVGFYDDGKQLGCSNEYGTVLGGITELNSITEPLAVIMAIGSPKSVKRIVDNIHSPLVEFPNLFSPDIVYLNKDDLCIGKGNIICSGCFVSCNVAIGDFNTIHVQTTLGHDTILGNYNSIMPAVHISGEVQVGDGNFFGVSSVILQQLKIGNNTTIGANSLIGRNTKDGMTYIGNPAKAFSAVMNE